MRIAIFGTNFAPTPPKQEIYAPLWIAWHLAEGLKKRGHKVFLFGSSDSKTSAELISLGLPSFRSNKEWMRAFKNLNEKETLIMKGKYQYMWAVKWKEILRENYELLLASELCCMAQKGMFDIVQFHSPLRALHFSRFMKAAVFCTIHDALSHPFESSAVGTIAKALNKARNINFVSISNAQKKPMPLLNWVATVYNGADLNKFEFSAKKGEYLAFAGRIIPQKGLDIAVRIAKRTGERLKIAGPVSAEHNSYWKEKIKPYLSKKITYEGMLSAEQMPDFYQKAKVLLMPIMWPEPFGLVMIEAMATGTPVITFNRGAAKEVVKHGKTGFVVKTEREMAGAIQKISQISRQDCRNWVEKKFSLEKMVNGYEKAYIEALKKR